MRSNTKWLGSLCMQVQIQITDRLRLPTTARGSRHVISYWEGSFLKNLRRLRTITNGCDYLEEFIDNSKITKTHKMVLPPSLQTLEEELILNFTDINSQDVMGHTPLA